MKLKIAKDLSFPTDAVTQTFLIVGKRGSGKSNTAARFVEQLYHAKLPFVVLDVTDTWWGLKAGRDGGRGLDVYVFGGRKADLPLEAGGGALIAEVLCEHRLSMVLSVKHLSGRERSRFMVAFAQTLFQKWGGGPLHVVLEEAHELAPQMSGGRGLRDNEDGEAAMLGAFKRLWKLGRSSGIGGTAVTQRPASLSKDITTQSEILIAHRTIGPQDVKAIGEWVKYHGEHLDILGELPSMPTGRAIVWAPEFPEGQPLGLIRTNVLLRETYDSASTPKVGEKRVEPKELAAVDLERLRAKMSATIEKAKADDPRELRKQIAELKKQVAQATAQPNTKSELIRQPVKTVEKFVLKEGQLARAEKLIGQIAAKMEPLRKLQEQFEAAKLQIIGAIERATLPQHTPTTTAVERPSPHARRVAPAQAQATSSRPARVVSPESSNGDLSGPEQRVIDAIAWLESLGIQEAEQTAVAFLANYTYGAGSFNNPKGSLRVKGLVEYLPGKRIALTDAGRATARVPDAALTPDALHARVLDRLPGPEQRLLRPLLDAYPNAIANADLAAAAGYALGAGSFNNPRGRLRSLGLIDYKPAGHCVAKPLLFLEER